MTVVAVTGLRAEARLAARAGLAVVCAGGLPERTAAVLDAALGAEVRGLVSLGIAGGLAPDLKAGTLILARGVIAGSTRFPVHARWASAVHGCTGGIEGDIIGTETIIATAAEKSGLHNRTAALAVDLESVVVARAAERAGLPFIVLRVIADPATRDLPAAALLPLDVDGRPNLRRVLHSLLGEPRQLGGLLRAANDTRLAFRVLRRGLRAAGPTLDPWS